jgi:hypothetical protein
MRQVGTRQDGVFELLPVEGVLELFDVRAVSDGAHVGYIQGTPVRLIPPRDRPELTALLREICAAASTLGWLKPGGVGSGLVADF